MLGIALVTLATVWILLLLVAFADAAISPDPSDHKPPRYRWRF
jgi:hypothetical protein